MPTQTTPTPIDTSARDETVRRVVFERLVDELEQLEQLVTVDQEYDRQDVRERVGETGMLALVLEELPQ